MGGNLRNELQKRVGKIRGMQKRVFSKSKVRGVVNSFCKQNGYAAACLGGEDSGQKPPLKLRSKKSRIKQGGRFRSHPAFTSHGDAEGSSKNKGQRRMTAVVGIWDLGQNVSRRKKKVHWKGEK